MSPPRSLPCGPLTPPSHHRLGLPGRFQAPEVEEAPEVHEQALCSLRTKVPDTRPLGTDFGPEHEVEVEGLAQITPVGSLDAKPLEKCVDLVK